MMVMLIGANSMTAMGDCPMAKKNVGAAPHRHLILTNFVEWQNVPSRHLFHLNASKLAFCVHVECILCWM